MTNKETIWVIAAISFILVVGAYFVSSSREVKNFEPDSKTITTETK